MEDSITNILVPLAINHPWILAALSIIAAFRVVVKPIFSAIQTYVANSPSKTDDEWLIKAESSKWYQALHWVVDLLFSIKLDTIKAGVEAKKARADDAAPFTSTNPPMPK